MVTIKEVAKLAGVSPTTASYALNNRPEVKEATRNKVQWAAKQLNYVPNKLAQSIRNGKSNTIMVVTSESIDCGNTFSAEFLGILSGAKQLNYDVLVKLVNSQSIRDNEIDDLTGSFCDGHLLLGNHLDRIAQVLTERDKKCIMLSSHSDAPICQVNSDGRLWIRKITEHVIAQGRKKAAYFCYELGTVDENLRYLGYCDAIAENMSGQEPLLFCCGPNGAELSTKVQEAILAGCDAIICWNDFLAVQVIEQLHSFGHCVPQQIAVTGFDDNLSYSNSIYHLTTVRQDFRLKGETAIKELVDQINGKIPLERNIFVDCSLVERSSTG